MATTDEEIKEAFGVFDADNVGFIQVSDVGTVIRALGKAPLESEVDALLETVGEGPVDFKTFKSLYSRKMKKPFELESDMRQAFRSLDNAGNGTISETDLRVLLGTLGEPMENTDIEALLKCVTTDSDGNLAYDELIDMLIK